MIARYSREPMARIWNEQSRYEYWWKVELAALEARAEAGEVDPGVVQSVRERARFTTEEINAVESEVQHDVIAFLTVIARHVGPDSRWVHLGLTSSDIVDSAFALQIRESAMLIAEDIAALRVILRRRALEFRQTPAVGRTHGMHAEPTVFGLRFALWDDEFSRHQVRLEQCMQRVAVGKLSGAVGIYGHTTPRLEEAVMGRLGLGTAPVSTQIVSRDRHAEFIGLLAQIASTVEKIATEIRHLQRTEVGEAYEPFGAKQKGSSAMPHKRNPILCERLCGMARLMRGYSTTALENVALWHERDISHSSAERVLFPDACIGLDYMLHVLIKILDGLDVRPERMKSNFQLSRGLLASENVLLALAEAGWTREDAYAAVQSAAKRVMNGHRQLVDELIEDSAITGALGADRVSVLCKIEPRYDMAEAIYRRLNLVDESN